MGGTVDSVHSTREPRRGARAVPYLEVAFHPDIRVIGGATAPGAFQPADDGLSLVVGRTAPAFRLADGRAVALADPCLSERFCRVSYDPSHKAFHVEKFPTARRELSFFDAEFRETGPADGALPPGAAIGLGERVLLCLRCDAPGMGEDRDFGLSGRSAALRKVRSLIRRIAPTSATVLVRGESGTGKELVARALHEHSERRRGPFVPLNCAALPRDILESELFGHERGVFTGAFQRQDGVIVQAQRGTLFLDEVGELPLELQAKFLRVLQEREVRRVGAAESLRVDVRFVAATNRDLAAAVAAGQFRQDLYYRLNVVPIDVPPLRERREDIPFLARDLLELIIDEGHDHPGQRPLLSLRQDVTRARPLLPFAEYLALLRHPWPGNVRELQHALRRAAALRDEGGYLRVGLPPAPAAPPVAATPERAPERAPARRPDARPEHLPRAEVEALYRAVDCSPARLAKALGIGRNRLYDLTRGQGFPVAAHLPEEQVRAALERCSHDVRRAAQALLVSYHGLRLRMKALGISADPPARN